MNEYLNRIYEKVYNLTDISVNAIKSRCRKSELVFLRSCLCYLFHKYLNLKFEYIAKEFNLKTHATLIINSKSFNSDMALYPNEIILNKLSRKQIFDNLTYYFENNQYYFENSIDKLVNKIYSEINDNHKINSIRFTSKRIRTKLNWSHFLNNSIKKSWNDLTLKEKKIAFIMAYKIFKIHNNLKNKNDEKT